MKLYSTPEDRHIATLTAELAEARNMLADAADEVEQWGAYASEYFQQKHDLAGTVCRLRSLASGGTMVTDADRLRADLAEARKQRDSLRDECERLREALPRISATLRQGGASLPAPDNDGTIDSAIRTGMSIAMFVVEDELAALSASGRDADGDGRGVEGGR